LFSLRELTDAISSSSDSATGPDGIHYQFLKHLPQNSLNLLLEIINDIWTGGTFPDEWHKAVVVAIPKPGKDYSDANSYRPIALTSCLCKIMERMVNC
jgi:potassium voltage-gated channel Eag-related subfamily H protein 8